MKTISGKQKLLFPIPTSQQSTCKITVQTDIPFMSNPDLNYDLVRVPTNGVNAYRVHGWELGIASSSKHKEEAWKFIDFLLSKDVNARVAKASRALPGNLESIDLVSAEATPVMKTQMNILSGDEPVEELRQAPSAVPAAVTAKF